MDLQTFVCETLCQIQAGVQDAIKRGGAGVINPLFSRYDQDKQDIVEKVTFDVAVTASEGEEREGKAGLRVWSVGVGGAIKGATASETVSRVQFAVRIVAPTTAVATDKTDHIARASDAAMADHRARGGGGAP